MSDPSDKNKGESARPHVTFIGTIHPPDVSTYGSSHKDSTDTSLSHHPKEMISTWTGIKQGMATGEVDPLHPLPTTTASSAAAPRMSSSGPTSTSSDVKPLGLSSGGTTQPNLFSSGTNLPNLPDLSSTSRALAMGTGVPPSPFHALSAVDASGYEVNLTDFVGKPVIVVNVALESALSSQFTTLQALYDKYHKLGLEILGFPCNQFGGGAPGSALEIKNHCARTYGVTFPIMEKVDVEGDNAHIVFKYLKSQKKNMLLEGVKWNFEKFLIDGQGHVVERWSSLASPESIEPHIIRLLGLPEKQSE
jgi:glutathione peroxidase